MQLFVYYKFIPKDFPHLHAAIIQMQLNISNHFPGLIYRLSKRPTLDDQGRETWMEQYDFVHEIFDLLMLKLSEEVAKLGSIPHRANEVFIDH
ncbi:MAG: DUF4936 family protein [Burkholderiaceae bacterium]|jgi:hypothetical protein|nr:DUF4936 family protein [Burkholderiaceae bacterium]MDP4969669.1 DUF4936 family protein [Burkholderiaceae bacterium]MDP5111820.1 DUF4936 family protein [Burkholderiaceae bacterium]